MAFGPHAPVLLTGDDYGNVNVYRLHRIFNKHIVDSSKFSAKEDREWRSQEAHHLKYVLDNKNKVEGGASTASETAGSGSSDSATVTAAATTISVVAVENTTGGEASSAST